MAFDIARTLTDRTASLQLTIGDNFSRFRQTIMSSSPQDTTVVARMLLDGFRDEAQDLMVIFEKEMGRLINYSERCYVPGMFYNGFQK